MRVAATPFSDVSQLRAIERRIADRPDEISLRFARGVCLEDLGRPDDAVAAYEDVLTRDPRHFGSLTNLGSLSLEHGQPLRAWACFQRALAVAPDDLIGRINAAQFALLCGDLALARTHYEAVLLARPDDPNGTLHANLGLAEVAERAGDADAADAYRQHAFARPIVWTLPYHGRVTPVRVLVLTSGRGGDVVGNFSFDDTIVQRTIMMPQAYAPNVVLPPHDVIFNGIGEPDRNRGALEAATRVVEASNAPVINDPRAVLTTDRATVMERLAGIDGAIVPRTRRYARSAVTAERLVADGFAFPLLLRSVGFQTGAHFERVDAVADVARVVAGLPGPEFFAIEHLDARGADGWVRKYRVAFVGGTLHPVHLAISRAWKVHYFSSAMRDDAGHREEEGRFLDDMPGVLRPTGLRALGAIAERLGLDLAGADVGRTPDGRLIVFEANATMAIYPPGDDPCWDYRRAPVARAIAAVRALVVDRARAPRPDQNSFERSQPA